MIAETQQADSNSNNGGSVHEFVDNEAAIRHIKHIATVWRRMHILFNFGIALLGTSTIASSIFVSVYSGYTDATFFEPKTLKAVAYVSTISLTLLTAFNFVGNTNNANQCWKFVKVALLKYDCKIYNIKQLIEAYSQAERMMGKIEFNYTVSPSSNTSDEEKKLEQQG